MRSGKKVARRGVGGPGEEEETWEGLLFEYRILNALPFVKGDPPIELRSVDFGAYWAARRCYLLAQAAYYGKMKNGQTA